MTISRSTCLSLLALGVLLAPGCGGGGDSSGSPGITLQIPVTNSLDGYVRSDGVAEANGGGPAVGDLDSVWPGLGFRQFFSFTLAGIPPGSTVVSATLQVNQYMTGGTPFTNHGNVLLDHLDYGASLGGGDYAAPAITSAYRVLASDTTLGFRILDVTSAVQADLAAGRLRSQYRARFAVASDGDSVSDFVAFTDGELSHGGEVPGQAPTLFVTLLP